LAHSSTPVAAHSTTPTRAHLSSKTKKTRDWRTLSLIFCEIKYANPHLRYFFVSFNLLILKELAIFAEQKCVNTQKK
jgi:hypothetical protein